MCDCKNDSDFISTYLTDDEIEFIEGYRKLSDEGKVKFTEYFLSLETPDDYPD